MKKIYRVKTEKDFKQIFACHQSNANKQCVIYTLKKENQIHFRVGISVSKKLGNAVIRNKIKRKIRQAVQQLEDKLLPDYDMVIIARLPMKEMSVEQVTASLLHVAKRAQIVKEEFLEG